MGKLKADFYGSKLPVSLDLPTFVDKSGLGNEWFEKAKCRGINPEMFHPGSNRSYMGKAARDICSRCVVIEECLIYAVTNNIHAGIWGGLNERERQKVKIKNRKGNSEVK